MAKNELEENGKSTRIANSAFLFHRNSNGSRSIGDGLFRKLPNTKSLLIGNMDVMHQVAIAERN